MVADMSSGCINHPSVQAIGRCKQCGKPYCSTCEVAGPTGNFCAEACKERHEVFIKRAAKLDDMQTSSGFLGKLMTRIKKFLVFAAALLIILVLLHFFGVNVPVLSDVLNDIF